jgi:hypothetical protein
MTKAEWTREAVIYALTRDQGIPVNVFKLLDGPKLRDAVKRVAKRRGMSAASYTTLACRQHVQRDAYARDWLTELDLGLTDEPGSWSLH